LFLGLDVGTQSVRAGLFDASGRRVALATSALDTTYPQPGWAEQDPNQWWSAACAAVPAALSQAGVAADAVAALGLDSTACTVVACRNDGIPLHPALLWMDQRAAVEADEINATGDAILRWVSGTVSPEWMLPKAKWLQRHRPSVFERADRIVECTDWLMHRLTGAWTLALNHVTVKWNHARPDGGWSRTLLRDLQLERLLEKWPETIVPLGGGSAELTTEAARALGLRPGLPVAHGGIDAYAGMLGLGAVKPGILAMILGSSTCHLAMAETPLLGSGMMGCYPDAVTPGTYTLEGGQTATGSILEWYRRHLAGNEAREAEQTGRSVFEVLDAKAAAVPVGCDGVLALDYWQGARSPRKDARARGLWWGMTLAHTAGHLVRSVYEATALGTRHILEDLAQHGLTVGQLCAGGGGAKSRLWMQIHADACGLPIAIPEETESCALGSAMLAAVRAGEFPDLPAAARAMVRLAEIVEPNPRHRAEYDALFARYIAAHDALSTIA
jgi:FGGY-family pentulose kinase